TELSSLAPDEPTPALLTRTSMRPNLSITCPTAVATDSSLVTSRSTSVTPRAGVAREASRLVPTTSKPAATSAAAVALPMPDDAPVTRATGCVAFIICLLGILSCRTWDSDRRRDGVEPAVLRRLGVLAGGSARDQDAR